MPDLGRPEEVTARDRHTAAAQVQDPSLAEVRVPPGSPLVRAGSSLPPRGVLALQRSVGNGGVTQLLGARRPTVQRAATVQRTPDREAIDRALKSGQYFDIAGVKDFGAASDAERVSLSDIAIATGYTDARGAADAVYALWTGMGERQKGVAAANEASWEKATRFTPRLMALEIVRKAQDDFAVTMNALADGNLAENQNYVKERKNLLGLGDQKEPLSAAEKANLRHNVQANAWSAYELKQAQARCRAMVVGYAAQNLGFGEHEWHFDPGQPPPVKATLFSKPPQKHEDVKEAWDTAEEHLVDIGNDYPELYGAAMADEDGAALLQLSRVVPEKYEENVGTHLIELGKRIQQVRDQIKGGEIKLLGLPVLHQSIFAGAGGAPGHDWTTGFDQWAAKRLIAAHEADKAATRMMLTSVQTVAMIIGTFGGGIGRMAATGVAIGLEAFTAGQDIAEASKLQQAARATPLKGTALVSRIEADAKKGAAVVRMVQAMVAALLAGGAAISSGLRAIRLKALVPDAAQLERLRKLAGNDAGLEALLKKMNDPGAAEDLLQRAGSLAKASAVLNTREVFRQRFAERYSKDIGEVQKLKATVPELAKIPDEELMALRGYTAEDYDAINRALRSGAGGEAELARLQPYIDTVKSGLDRFPEFKGAVTRVESNTHMLYEPGKTVTMQGFTSTCGPGGKVTSQIMGNTSLEIQSVTGRDIRAIAAHPKEAEVLFAPGKTFRVVSKTQPVPGWYRVKLEEVPH